VNVITGDICQEECRQLIKEDFDLVIISDVLEHVTCPQVVLEEIKSYLRQQSHVLVSLPNIAHFRMRLHLLRGRFDYTDEGILDKTHLRFYTLRTARELIESCGYNIVDFTMPFESKNTFSKWVHQYLAPCFPGLFGTGTAVSETITNTYRCCTS